MKICKRGLDMFQVYDSNGSVRLCSWTTDGKYVGNLIDNSVDEVYHSDAADKVRKRLFSQDYSLCMIDACPYKARGEMSKILVEKESVEKYPEELWLAFENTCNYNCRSCNIHEVQEDAVVHNIEKRYDKIVHELKVALPYVKKISANGFGELFVSKRTLQLLSEWRPIAPKDEVSVSLETNGLLFDEKHWKQIENLGQYNLRVNISVMSFDEKTYQVLSGVREPISHIEDSLRFVKTLREKEIINEFEIATVVQERNFRTMKEFVRKAIDEFGADIVRLRPYQPWGRYPLEMEWFFDVRNQYHPYHQEYIEYMQDNIFKHPKVRDWSGGLISTTGPHPIAIEKKKVHILSRMMINKKELNETIDSSCSDSKIIIYGAGELGKVFSALIFKNKKIACFIDIRSVEKEYCGIPIIRPDECDDRTKQLSVFISLIGERGIIENQLRQEGFLGDFYRLDDLIE